MTNKGSRAVVRHLDILFNVGSMRDLSDGQLLELFSTGPRNRAECAFEALVQRHGAMVLRVCRARLADPHDASDAFQATFLILLKKARSLWVRDSLGPWLHQVACRTSSCARASASRRRKHERIVAESATIIESQSESSSVDWEDILNEEINRLPSRYRSPIILCDLQGHTCEEAARQLGHPVGTVKSWRSRGRAKLRESLLRRGIAPSVVLSTMLTRDLARATMLEPMVRFVAQSGASLMKAEEVSAPVQMLVKGVLKTMLIKKIQFTASLVFAAAILAGTFGVIERSIAEDARKPNDPGLVVPPKPLTAETKPQKADSTDRKPEAWRLSLRDAILIGLDNSEKIRLISSRETIQISPVDAKVDPQQFRTELMASVRSIAQQYWSLAQVYAQRDAAEKAREMGQVIMNRLKAELSSGKGTVADVAEAEQRLEQFNLDLVTRKSDLTTTERQLRNILGLSPSEDRKIEPITVPREDRINPDWDFTLKLMKDKHPELRQISDRVKQAEISKEISDSDRLALVESRKNSLGKSLHETTHALARFFMECDANYKQFTNASRLRAAALTRLEAQRAYFDEGRITVDRFLDGVSQYHTAVAAEAQYKTLYNISIISLQEASGTILEDNKIEVLDNKIEALVASGPSVAKEALPLKRALPAVPPPVSPNHVEVPEPQTSHPPKDESVSTSASTLNNSAQGKTVSFDFNLGVGGTPIQIKGSFTISTDQAASPKG